MVSPTRLRKKLSIGPRKRPVNGLNGPMGKEPQAPSSWAIAVGMSNLTLRGWDNDLSLPARRTLAETPAPWWYGSLQKCAALARQGWGLPEFAHRLPMV